MSHVTIDAPVKVNLHLGIHPGRDSRGYHRADSVMVALGVGDTVTVSTPPEPPAADASGVLLAMSEDVGVPPQKNTAWQAAARLRRAFGITTPVRVEVCKAVPPQSGLGGSSSDAASVILALCRLFSLDEKDPRIVDVARSVGADVPFFLNLAPSYLTGAGDVLAQTFPVLEGLPVVLVRPRGVSRVRRGPRCSRIARAHAGGAARWRRRGRGGCAVQQPGGRGYTPCSRNLARKVVAAAPSRCGGGAGNRVW